MEKFCRFLVVFVGAWCNRERARDARRPAAGRAISPHLLESTRPIYVTAHLMFDSFFLHPLKVSPSKIPYHKKDFKILMSSAFASKRVATGIRDVELDYINYKWITLVNLLLNEKIWIPVSFKCISLRVGIVTSYVFNITLIFFLLLISHKA